MFNSRCPLRWSDLDAQGHVNNALLVDYLQEARVRFFRSGTASGLLDSGVVVVAHQVEYRRAIEYSDDGVDIDLEVAAVGGARFEVAYDVRQAGELVARARTVLCPFDFDANRPTRIPAADRDFLLSHLADVEPLRELNVPQLAGRGTATNLFVRWSDLDSYGHVNNAKVYDYLQQARITATTRWDPTMARAGSGDSEHLWLVARQDVDYVAQLNHQVAPLAVRTAPVALGGSSITLASEVTDPDSGAVLVRGRTVLVCADRSGRPAPLTQATRDALAPLVVA